MPVIEDAAEALGSSYHGRTPGVFGKAGIYSFNSMTLKVHNIETWATTALAGPALGAVEKLVAKTDSFVLAIDHPTAYRTSNIVDRHRDPMDRWLFHARFFPGDWPSAQLQARSRALFHNFLPAHKLNGFVYHDNWLHNLLISTSVSGCSPHHRFQQN